MGKAALFVLIAAAAGLIVYLLAAPRFVHTHNPSASPETPPAPQAPSARLQSGDAPNVRPPSSSEETPSGTDTVDSAPAIEAPRTGDERSHQDLEAKRGPLYDWIRANLQKILVGWQPSKADPATLDLYMARADSSDINLCMDKLVQPYASHYGFNHVRFNTANPVNETDQWHVDSEASPDSDGVWRLYKK